MVSIRETITENLQYMKDAFWLLVYTLIGGLLPMWGGIILVRLFGQWRGWGLFCQQGEFAIYSAALLAPAIYLITRSAQMALKRILLLVAVVSLFISGIVFAGVKSGQLFGTSFDSNFLRDTTLILFVASTLLFYLVNVFECARLGADIQKARAESLKTLEKEFDKLGG